MTVEEYRELVAAAWERRFLADRRDAGDEAATTS